MTQRRLVIGTDEAGYGPNLGPLVITATAWSLPLDCHIDEMWDRLRTVIRRQAASDDRRLHVADSKQVYSASGGIDSLERSVLAFLRLHHDLDNLTVRRFGLMTSSPEFCDHYDSDPCRHKDHQPLPRAADGLEVEELSDELRRTLAAADVQLLGVQSRIMMPAEFNTLCRQTESKGTVLSQATLQLVRDYIDGHPDRTGAAVYCDKHGGRNRYDELIAELLDDTFVFRVQESRSVSRYRAGDLEFWFRSRAEELLPVALASMFAKYTREILMEEFNAFWRTHVPAVKPTKGYPTDAVRFREDIADVAELLGIRPSCWWRSR